MTKPTFTSLETLTPAIVKRATTFHKKRRLALAERESMTDASDIDLCLEVWYRHQTRRRGQTVADIHRSAMTHVLADLEKRRRARLIPLINQALAVAQVLNKPDQADARTTVLRLVEALSGRQKDGLT